MSSYVSCKNLVKAYRVDDHELVALKGIDFNMEQGEMVAIVGPSGAGKSTLLNLLGGLDTPTAGKLKVGDFDLLELKGRRLADYRLRKVGFVWQQVERNLLSQRSALRNVTLPMLMAGVGTRQRNKKAHDLLISVGLKDHLHKRPPTLSGGQQQRVAIAVALANHPSLLLADEPTGALDRQSATQVMQLIHELRQRYGLTVLMVTHDMEMAAYADRTLTLRDGALGQDMSALEDQTPKLDSEGKIQLPSAVRSHLQEVDRITVEIRPEGILLRPEVKEADNTAVLLHDMLPQDAAPNKRRWLYLRRKKVKPS
jgi:ABC-type lipoprotein export system ATPase subunit